MANAGSPRLTLASASPRRRNLLALTGWTFQTTSAPVEETPQPGETAEALAARLARQKAHSAARSAGGSGWVLAADTLVVDGGQPLGKPADGREALEMLHSLRGRQHQVITSIAILDPATGEQATETCTSSVPMRSYRPAEAAAFVARGEALDKAGAYAIQDPHFRPVDIEHMRDCYANVMGLPLCHLVRAMRRMGAEPPRDVPHACQQHTGYDCPVYAEILDGRR